MRVMRSLSGQLAAGVAAVVLIVVSLSGIVIVLQIDARERAALDAALEVRLTRVGADLKKIDEEDHASGPEDDNYGGLLAGSSSLVRLIDDGLVVAQRGEIPETPAPLPVADGYSTVSVDGEPWRSLAATDSDGIQLQVLESLAPVQQQLRANAWLVVVITAVAVMCATIGGWLVARWVALPLRRLTRGASTVRTDVDATDQVPNIDRPEEVAELAATLNGMLERLHGSMKATRRFTADAGHELRNPLASLGAYLAILARNPDLPAERRQEALESAIAEHQRAAALLDGLQTLARGDATALPAREHVDLVDIASEELRSARLRHNSVSFAFRDELGPGAGVVAGWRDGLGTAIRNLVTNAAIHGKPGGEVVLTVASGDERVYVKVDDDGPGIPPAERDAMRRRFVRGRAPRAPGSGLGLALVEQQAALHGGELLLADSETGGLSATISLPVVATKKAANS